MKITATAPTRIDLAGGTIDLWPIHHLLDHKATVNVGITCTATVQITETGNKLFKFISEDTNKTVQGTFSEICQNTELPLFSLLLGHFWQDQYRGLEIHTMAKSPAGAGLGGSSCLAVTMGAALLKARNYKVKNFSLNEYELVQTVQNIEARLIQAPTGCQDYWGAMRGGVNYISYPYSGPLVKTFEADLVAKKLDPMLIACYSGKSRASALNNWEIFKQIFNGDKLLLNKFNEIGKLAEQCASSLQHGDILTAIQASEKEWRIRQSLWPNIETDETKKIDQAAIKAGAYFSRVCGAGGGGVMAVLTPPEKKMQVIAALKAAGGTVLDAVVATEGLRVMAD